MGQRLRDLGVYEQHCKFQKPWSVCAARARPVVKEARVAGQVGRNPVTWSHLNLENELCVEDGLEQAAHGKGCCSKKAEGAAG